MGWEKPRGATGLPVRSDRGLEWLGMSWEGSLRSALWTLTCACLHFCQIGFPTWLPSYRPPLPDRVSCGRLAGCELGPSGPSGTGPLLSPFCKRARIRGS